MYGDYLYQWHARGVYMLGNRGIPVLLCEADPVTAEDFRIVFAKPGDGKGLSEDQSLEASLMRALLEGTADPEVDLQVCRDGPAALVAFREAREKRCPFQVAFVDLGPPPDYWGLDTAEEMRALDPTLHIVLMVSRLEAEPGALFARVPPADRLSVCCKPLHGFEIDHLVSAAAARQRRETASNRDLAVLKAQSAFDRRYPDPESLSKSLGLIRNALAALLSHIASHNRHTRVAPAHGTGTASLASSQLSLDPFDYGLASGAALELAESAAALVDILDPSALKAEPSVPRKRPPRT